jgi:uncharacterized protein (DUF58 family)
LADLREYQPYDDVRHIDWNVTARLNTPHVRQYMEDRDLSLWLLMDLSNSMLCGGQERSKWHVAVEFAGVLARLCTRHGNRVGAMLYGNQVDTVIPAHSGKTHVLQLLRQMIDRPAPKPHQRGTQLHEFLEAAQRTIKRRSCLMVVSDFISEGDWPAALTRLSMRHDVTAIRVTSPLDTALPEVGWITVNDAETGEQYTLDTDNPALLARYSRAAEEFDTRLQETLCATGVDTLELSTESSLLDELLRFTELRRRSHRFAPSSRVSSP